VSIGVPSGVLKRFSIPSLYSFVLGITRFGYSEYYRFVLRIIAYFWPAKPIYDGAALIEDRADQPKWFTMPGSE
jgi:hypothetical protein